MSDQRCTCHGGPVGAVVVWPLLAAAVGPVELLATAALFAGNGAGRAAAAVGPVELLATAVRPGGNGAGRALCPIGFGRCAGHPQGVEQM